MSEDSLITNVLTQAIDTNPIGELAFSPVSTRLGSMRYYFSPGHRDAILTGTEYYISPDKPLGRHLITISTANQLTEYPTSPASLAINEMLRLAESEQMLRMQSKFSTKGTKIKDRIKYHIANESADYMRQKQTSALHRELLMNVTLQDPVDASQKLDFRMISHEGETKSGFNGYAMYNAESQSLIIVFPGVDPTNLAEVRSLSHTFRGGQNPQREFADLFMEHVVEELHKSGLPLKSTIINAHSFGAGNGLQALAWCIKHPEKAAILGDATPKLISVEGCDERRAGEHIAAQSNIPKEELKKHVHSVRVYPGSLINVSGNEPFGKHITAILPHELDVSFMAAFKRNFAHQAMVIADGLYNKTFSTIDNFGFSFKPMKSIDIFHGAVQKMTRFRSGVDREEQDKARTL